MMRRPSFLERHPRLHMALWIAVLIYVLGGAVAGGIAFYRMGAVYTETDSPR